MFLLRGLTKTRGRDESGPYAIHAVLLKSPHGSRSNGGVGRLLRGSIGDSRICWSAVGRTRVDWLLRSAVGGARICWLLRGSVGGVAGKIIGGRWCRGLAPLLSRRLTTTIEWRWWWPTPGCTSRRLRLCRRTIRRCQCIILATGTTIYFTGCEWPPTALATPDRGIAVRWIH